MRIERDLDPGTVAELAGRARAADGVAPFSDDLSRAFATGGTALRLAGHVDGELIGAAFAAEQGERLAAELVVDPGHRRRGYGGALLAELLDALPGELWVWSHGDHPAAAALARRHGLARARELLQLRRPVAPGDPPGVPLPDGVRLRPFVPGRDEPAWLEVNNAAFSWHPEQGGQTLDDIRAAERSADFDPAGFLLAVDDDDRLLGFHWTKVHPRDPSPGRDTLPRRDPEPGGRDTLPRRGRESGGRDTLPRRGRESGGRDTLPRRGRESDSQDTPPRDGPDEPIGEVYVLGVAPWAHGRGLGAALTVAGLRHLAEVAGVRTVTLYVEGDNAAAVRLYQRLGFTRHAIDVAYRRDQPGRDLA